MGHRQGISRRNFLGAAAGVGALTAMGLVGCSSNAAAPAADEEKAADAKAPANDWLGEAPEIAESDISETKETDLLIVGAGNGGLAAAATAADLGLDFMLCEKMKSIQRTRHWFGAINTRYTKDAGLEVDEGRLLNEWARYASGQCDQRVIRVWIRESSDMVEWIDPILTAAGMTCEFDADIDHETGGTGYYVAPMQHYYAGKDANGDRLERNKVLLAYINNPISNYSSFYSSIHCLFCYFHKIFNLVRNISSFLLDSMRAGRSS